MTKRSWCQGMTSLKICRFPFNQATSILTPKDRLIPRNRFQLPLNSDFRTIKKRFRKVLFDLSGYVSASSLFWKNFFAFNSVSSALSLTYDNSELILRITKNWISIQFSHDSRCKLLLTTLLICIICIPLGFHFTSARVFVMTREMIPRRERKVTGAKAFSDRFRCQTQLSKWLIHFQAVPTSDHQTTGRLLWITPN